MNERIEHKSNRPRRDRLYKIIFEADTPVDKWFDIVLIVVILGSLMYLIESSINSGFTSIPQGMYRAIVTLTTVGYGDISPQTPLGQFLASTVMILGIPASCSLTTRKGRGDLLNDMWVEDFSESYLGKTARGPRGPNYPPGLP